MTPAEQVVLAAARRYRDSMRGVDHPGTTVARAQDLMFAAESLVDDAPPLLPTDPAAEQRMDAIFAGKYAAEVKTPLRPWPDPEAYTLLRAAVFSEAGADALDGPGLSREVGPAVAAWKALRHGERVMCARGYQWTADRSTGRLRFTQARKDGSPGKTLDQPWHPLIMARLPAWPIVIEADA